MQIDHLTIYWSQSAEKGAPPLAQLFVGAKEMNMEDRMAALDEIRTEITTDIADVRDRFLKEFPGEIEEFVEHMADAFLNWRKLDAKIGTDVRLAHVSALVYSAVTLHILSMKLLMSGHIVAAGNLMRQVVESMATGLLCSATSLGILDKYIKGKYSTNKSIDQVIKYADKVGAKREALKQLQKTQVFYHKYSHPSLFTVASHICFDTEGALYVGCSFDEGKVVQYRKEVKGRLGLAKVFPNFVQGIANNMK